MNICAGKKKKKKRSEVKPRCLIRRRFAAGVILVGGSHDAEDESLTSSSRLSRVKSSFVRAFYRIGCDKRNTPTARHDKQMQKRVEAATPTTEIVGTQWDASTPRAARGNGKNKTRGKTNDLAGNASVEKGQ